MLLLVQKMLLTALVPAFNLKINFYTVLLHCVKAAIIGCFYMVQNDGKRNILAGGYYAK